MFDNLHRRRVTWMFNLALLAYFTGNFIVDEYFSPYRSRPTNHARGLRLRRVRDRLALTPAAVSPSATWYGVGTPDAIISQLNTLPTCAPVNASVVALRLATHDSGSGWVATPFLYDSCIHDSTPVYPGAHHGLLGAAGERQSVDMTSGIADKAGSWRRRGMRPQGQHSRLSPRFCCWAGLLRPSG